MPLAAVASESWRKTVGQQLQLLCSIYELPSPRVYKRAPLALVVPRRAYAARLPIALYLHDAALVPLSGCCAACSPSSGQWASCRGRRTSICPSGYVWSPHPSSQRL